MTQQDKLTVPGEFRVIAYDSEPFIGDHAQIDYGDPLGERSRALLEEFPVEKAVAGCATEFEGFLALKRWVRGQWNHGWSKCFSEVKDGLDILRAVAKGEQFCCGHYAMVLRDCATALGWPTRLVGLAIAGCEFPRDYNVGNVGHAIAEMWSNEHEKWIAMDADMNCYYARDGVPLSALQVGQSWLSGEHEQVSVVQDQPEFVLPSGPTLEIATVGTPGLNEFDEDLCRLFFERFGRHRAIDYYARLRIGEWEWVDRRCLPTFISHFHPGAKRTWTCNADDLYWSLNKVRLSAQPAWEGEQAALTIGLEHCMPWFHHYETRVDGGDWRPAEQTFDWPMRKGANRLECRGVNQRQRPGIVSAIEVAYAPAIW